MSLVILHHHLLPGGVTRVIQSQIGAERMASSTTLMKILVGTRPETFDANGVDVKVEPELDYLEADLDECELKRRVGRIAEILNRNVGPDDLIHAHNLNLGKNPLLTMAVRDHVAHGRGNALIHCHDFIEDRPDNLAFAKRVVEGVFKRDWNDVCYPDSPTIRFAVLTTADKRRLVDAGIKASRVTVLPNPVDFGAIPDIESNPAEIRGALGLKGDKPMCVYPVRVIRRKNIGEFILLAALFGDRADWLATQPPKNPVEVAPYRRWKDFCRSRSIPVVFEAGTHVPFIDLLRAADRCVTTSVMEGFGMVYLEPWFFDTPVVGRNLPAVTKDLMESGIRFPLLYDKIIVQVDGNNVDFKSLTSERQRELLDLMLDDPATKMSIINANPQLNGLLADVQPDVIENNQRVIRDAYSLRRYGDLLRDVHQRFNADI